MYPWQMEKRELQKAKRELEAGTWKPLASKLL